MIIRDFLLDPSLSLKAKGIMCVILAWRNRDEIPSPEDLYVVSKEGRDSIRGAYKELVDAGYITVTKKHVAGRFRSERQLNRLPASERDESHRALRVDFLMEADERFYPEWEGSNSGMGEAGR